MINNTLKERRIIAGLTQSQLAQRVGVCQSVVAQWETGARSPNAKKQIEIDSVLDDDGAGLPFQIASILNQLHDNDREIFKDMAAAGLAVDVGVL